MKPFTTNGRINPNILSIAAYAAKYSKCSMPRIRALEGLARVGEALDHRLAERKKNDQTTLPIQGR